MDKKLTTRNRRSSSIILKLILTMELEKKMDYKALILALASISGPLSGADDFTKILQKNFCEIIESNDFFSNDHFPIE